MQCKMSNNSISTYKFKPFQFTVSKLILDSQQRPEMRLGHQTVCNNEYLFSIGKPERKYDVLGQRVSSATRHLWKYCFDLGEWKIIKCQNVTLELASSPVALFGNIIIIYRGTGVLSGGFCSNRLYLGNLANEYIENGMSFVNLEESGDVPIQLFGVGVVMDGKYIYSIGGTSGDGYEMGVHQFDLSTRKWELLHELVIGSEHRYHHVVVFYKRRIYIFGGVQCGPPTIIYDFSKIHMFDVATKQWKLLPTKHDHRLTEPGYPINRCWPRCAQCPEKSNLVYLCGGYKNSIFFRDVWRFDLDTLQWEKLSNNYVMHRLLYFHSTAITTSGRMICHGGTVGEYNIYDRRLRTNDITSAWIKIPKLKDICWEAMVYYFKKQMFESSDEHLKKIGLPPEYYKRIIKARRIS